MKTKLISAVVISVCVLLFSSQAIVEAESFRHDLPQVITVNESFSDTVSRVLPSVCMVISKVVVSTLPPIRRPEEKEKKEKKDNIPPFALDDPKNPTRPAPSSMMGTCFIVLYKNEKFVITNHHVVDSTENVTTKVRFYGTFKAYPAIIVGKDQLSDIAILKMGTPEGQAIIESINELQLGNSSNVRQGDDAWAIGHPMGQEWSVSRGIVSYIGRRTNNIRQELIQSDVAINTGNSGGPLLNTKGEVIGVNTFIISAKKGGGGQVGVNFSVTSNLTKRIIEQVIDTGSVKRAKIGIMFEVDYDEGLFVIKDLEPGGPAADAGIKAEDQIIKINGYDIYLMEDMGKAFDDVLPGDEIEVVILRGDETFKIIVKTAEIVVVEGH